MIYKYIHNNSLEQGDILINIPKVNPICLFSNENDDPWQEYIQCIRDKKYNPVEFSILPQPCIGVILTQTCTIENAKEEDTLLIAELQKKTEKNPFKNPEGGKNKKKSYINKIHNSLRHNKPQSHYFPEIDFSADDKYENHEWELNFKTIFSIPINTIKNNLDIFWKARILSEALVVLKDKISHFFTRLAFDDTIFHSKEEVLFEKRKSLENAKEITKRRKEYGLLDWDLEDE